MAIYKQDKFGNNQAIVALQDKKGNGYPKGYVKIKNKLYRVETASSNKDGVEAWVTLTEVSKRGNSRNGSL